MTRGKRLGVLSNLALLLLYQPVVGDLVTCSGKWTQLQHQLFRLSSPMHQAQLPQRLEELDLRGAVDGEKEGCLLGEMALRLTDHLSQSRQGPEAEEARVGSAWQALEADWRMLADLGWHIVLRSGWPLFQLLTLLSEGDDQNRDPTAACASTDLAAATAERLLSYLDPSTGSPKGSLVPSSLALLAASRDADCPLGVASTTVALALGRLPVFDGESEALLRRAASHVARTELSLVLTSPLPLLPLLARAAVVYQTALHHTSDEEEQGAGNAQEAGSCVVRSAETPSGRCNFFATIEQGLATWRERGVSLDDTMRAFRPVMDQKTILFRLIGEDLVVVTPKHSHLDIEFGATEPSCIANAILAVLAKVDVAEFDIVLSHGDLPTFRRRPDQPPFYGPMDRDARSPAPLFSICSSEDFWDILFPNVCRPALVNMSGMSRIPWEKKQAVAFWRGTDRGAVNWASSVQDMYKGSPRKHFLDAWGGTELYDLAFLEDDLLNATVVNTDPSFVPLDRWPEWRYLLDLPGNGYSGSLKQKLTSSSAVVLVTSVGAPSAKPVYEHYHGGLQDGIHVLQVTMDNAGEKLRWARQHDALMQQMVLNANAYMREFDTLTACYMWRLLDEYARLLLYKPTHAQTHSFPGEVSVRTVKVQRRPLRREAAEFKEGCRSLLKEHAL